MIKLPPLPPPPSPHLRSEPHEAFYSRVRSTPPRAAPPVSCIGALGHDSEAEELALLVGARQQLARIMAGIREQEASLMEAEGMGGGSGAGTPHGIYG